MYNNDFFFLILTLAFLLIALLKAFYWKFSKQLILSLFSQRHANQFLKEENVFTERVNFLITTVLIFNASLIISKILYSHELSVQLFLQVLLYVSCFYLIKILVIRLLGYIFILAPLAKLAVFFSLLYDRILGLTLFPFVVLLFYSSIHPQVILVGIITFILLLFLLLKLFWLWKLGYINWGFSKYYLFLYLCTIEILPFFILSKMVFF